MTKFNMAVAFLRATAGKPGTKEQKIQFLTEKGLTMEEIENAMDVATADLERPTEEDQLH